MTLPPADAPARPLRLGLMPLVDAAPLVVARELGFFARRGLDVTLSVEGSFAGIRDKLMAGLLDAAQLLAPMPLAAQLGLDGFGVPLVTGLTLSRNGNLITVSPALAAGMDATPDDPQAAAATLARALRTAAATDAVQRPFAHVFPYSSHHYLLRHWLSLGGIVCDRDLELMVVPPPLIVRSLSEGRIDGFCVGAPWGLVAENAGVGRNLLATRAVRADTSEKVLGVTADWARQHPETHAQLIAALIEAGRWLEDRAHRQEAARLLSLGAYVAVDAEVLAQALTSEAGDRLDAGFRFSDPTHGAPDHADADWFIAQMRRWGQIDGGRDTAGLAARTYRLDLHAAGLACL
jgi:nitrate/nitrite transport system substrate-binding protein